MVAKCSKCHSSSTPQEELAFNKVGKNSWGLICKSCLTSSGLKWHEPGELHWLGSYAGLYNTETTRLLSSIKEANGLIPDKIAENERRYERHNIVKRGFIKFPNKESEILVVIKDLSKGGLRFVSNTKFSIAQIANIRIESSKNSSKDSGFSDNIEIVRVIPQENGTYEMGARFLASETVEVAKKKKSRDSRHNLLLSLRYKATSSAPAAIGAVIELGRSNALLLMTDEMVKGDRFALQITGSTGVFAHQELSGLAMVKRSEMVYSGNFEVLVDLLKVNIKKI